MKLNVKTLKGTNFEVEASPDASVAEVKRIIETTQGQRTYPADQQMLIYQGTILKDETTLESNVVVENSTLVIMLSKAKASSSGASTATAAKAPATPAKALSSGASTATAAKAPATPAQPAAPVAPATSVARTPAQAPVATVERAPPSAQPQAAPAATIAASGDADVYSQAASNLVSGNNLEQTTQQTLQGIPENVEAPLVARAPAAGQETNQQAPSPAQPAVALPVQPSAASAGPNANPLNLCRQFKLAKTYFGNGVKYFCCQSSPCMGDSGKKDCPCAILAIWNYLILQDGAILESSTGYHCEQDIRKDIASRFAMNVNNQMEAGKVGSDEAVLWVAAQVLKIILNASSVVMCPSLTSADGFDKRSVEVYLFCILGIPIYHGHMIDSKKSSEERKGGALTAYGLSCLLEAQEEGKLAVLYMDGHFSVILKKERTLFILETDESVLKNQPDAIWKKLTLSEGDSFYLTSRFSPTKNQKNKEKANEWYDQNLKEKFGDSEGSAPRRKKGTRAERKLRVSVDHANGGNDTADSVGTADNHGDLPMVVKKNGTGPLVENSGDLITQQFPKANKAGDLTARFNDFLVEYKDNHTVPYFKGQLEAIKCLGLPKMYVPYEMIERHDKELAITIRDQPYRIDNDLKQAFVDYLVSNRFDRATVQDTAELHIAGLPKPKSTQSLTEFAAHNPLRKDYKLFGDIVISTSFDGRRMALGFLLYIISHHEAGLCWNGKFDASHFVVQHNGLQFVIDLDAEENLTKEGAVADLIQYCAIIFPFFEDEHGKYPLYFDRFQKDCLNMPDPKKEPEKWKKFLKLMRCHFALKAPAARSAFLVEIYTLASGRMVAGRPFSLLNTAKVLVEWRRNLRLLQPFKGVYDHNNYYMIDKWGCTYWYLLQFARHFLQHVLQYLKEKFMYHDITIIELMLSNQLEKSLADFMWYFIYNCDIDGIFDSAWDHFAASDCMDTTAKDGNEDAIKDQCPHIPECSTESDDIARLLFTVAAGSSSPFLDILIQAGVNPNMSAGGATPLHVAAESGHTEVIELLHAAGGDPNNCNADGLKPIQIAALRKNREAVELLLPWTTPLPSVLDWSFHGICEYTMSKYVGKSQVKGDPSLESTGLARPQSVEMSPVLEKKSIEANLRGNGAYEREEYIKALEAYTEAIDLDSNNATAWSNRSLCWLLIGIAEKALEDAQKCRVLRPDSGKPCYREGAALHELQRFFEAATAFYEGAILEQEKKDYLTAFRVSVVEGMKKYQRKPPEFPGRKHLSLVQL